MGLCGNLLKMQLFLASQHITSTLSDKLPTFYTISSLYPLNFTAPSENDISIVYYTKVPWNKPKLFTFSWYKLEIYLPGATINGRIISYDMPSINSWEWQELEGAVAIKGNRIDTSSTEHNNSPQSSKDLYGPPSFRQELLFLDGPFVTTEKGTYRWGVSLALRNPTYHPKNDFCSSFRLIPNNRGAIKSLKSASGLWVLFLSPLRKTFRVAFN